jgi:hypothetical protein
MKNSTLGVELLIRIRQSLFVMTLPAALLGCGGGTGLVPNANIVSGREKCATIGEASDCRAAANALCRSHGFEGGASNDIQTQYCVVAGANSPSNCTFVTRALCH